MSRLVHHPKPCPGESIISYLERLVRVNRYDPPHLLTGWLRTDEAGKSVSLSQALYLPTFYQRLADLSGQSQTNLLALTIHRYAPVLLPPTVSTTELVLADQVIPVFPSRNRQHLRPDKASVFCPACLQEKGYHRLAWQVTAVNACPQHARWLVDRCPQCSSPLSVRAIVAGHCARCACDLCQPDIASPVVDDLVLQSQRCLYAWLEGHPAPPELQLPAASGQVLFRVLDGLRLVTQLAHTDWAFAPAPQVRQLLPTNCRKRLTPFQAGVLYATALRGLKDWPDGFFSFLDAYRQRTNKHGLHSLGNLYTTWLGNHWQHAAFDFVQVAFEDYLTSHFPPVRSIMSSRRYKEQPEFADRFAYIDVRNAAHFLGVSPPKINRLIRDGFLDIYPEHDLRRPGYFLHRSQLESLRNKLKTVENQNAAQKRPTSSFLDVPGNLLLKGKAAAYLGIPLPQLNDLLAHGLLCATGRRRRADMLLEYLTQDDLNRFLDGLKAHVSAQPLPEQGAVVLPKAAILNGKVGMGLSAFIERVLAGKLAAYHPSPDLRPLTAIWFESNSVLSLTQQVKDENDWVSFLDTVALLGITRTVLHHWMDNGLLVPVASFARAQYFPRTAVLDLSDRCLTSDEAALMLHSNRSHLHIWAQAGYLQPLSGPGTGIPGHYIFDRLNVEDWRQAFASVAETGQLLQTTALQLRHWSRDGKLTRLSPGPRKPAFYRRDQVVALQHELVLKGLEQKL